MTDKELRRLSRQELVEIVYQLKKNEKKLQAQLAEAERKLEDRQLRLDKAGSIAEAALAVNGVFEAAQRAAEDYLNSIRGQYENVDDILAQAREYIDEDPEAAPNEAAASPDAPAEYMPPLGEE